MWHTLDYVAEQWKLDPVAFREFALAHRDEYSIITERGIPNVPEVSTWHVDDLIAAFRGSLALRQEKSMQDYNIPEPKSSFALVSCRVATGSWTAQKYERRLYEVRHAVDCNGYYSNASGGDVKWTAAHCGPHGETIRQVAKYVVTYGDMGGAYLGHFETWNDFLTFLSRRRAEDIEVLE